MQTGCSNNDIASKVLFPLAVIPIGILLIILVIPLLFIIVIIFLCFIYFSKRKFEKASYYKYINKRFSFRSRNTSKDEENPSEAIIEAKYKTLEDDNPK